MVLSVTVWALSHLLANGNLADLLLFGAFLLWSVLIYRASRARDRANPPKTTSEDTSAAPVPKMSATLTACVLGTLLWGGITFYLHAMVVGVSPLS
jgi:uncharacterized membrane protein